MSKRVVIAAVVAVVGVPSLGVAAVPVLAMTGATISLGVPATALLLILAGATLAATRRRQEKR